MDEAKTLFHMSISAMFAALLLGAIMAVLGFSYLMWSYFSKQDQANSKMAQYANLTAFDNTTLRGSEVESLLTYADTLGIYVIFFDSTSTNVLLNEHTALTAPIYYYANPQDSAYNIISSAPATPNTIPVCQAAIMKTVSCIGTGGDRYPKSPASNLGTDLYGLSRKDLVRLLTTSTELGDPKNEGSYGVFKSTLIYSGDTASDVVGIALVRANSYVTNYCVE